MKSNVIKLNDPFRYLFEGSIERGLCQMLYKLLEWQRLLGVGILVMSVAMHRSMSVLPCFPRGLGLFVCGRLCGCLPAGGFTRGGLVFGLQLVAGCLGLALIFVWGRTAGRFNRYFSRRFC